MVLMPITRPYASASGPPELPGARRTSASTQLCAAESRQAPERMHHTGGERADKAHGISDRHDQFAHAQRVRIAEDGRGQSAGFHLESG